MLLRFSLFVDLKESSNFRKFYLFFTRFVRNVYNSRCKITLNIYMKLENTIRMRHKAIQLGIRINREVYRNPPTIAPTDAIPNPHPNLSGFESAACVLLGVHF